MVEDVRLLGDGIDVEAEIHKLILRCILDSPEKPAPNPVRITLRITCGPRRARTLPGTVRGDAGRSYHRKVRDRPDRQVHALVSRRTHSVTLTLSSGLLETLVASPLRSLRISAGFGGCEIWNSHATAWHVKRILEP